MNKRALRPLFQILLIMALILVLGVVIVGCWLTHAILFPAPTYRIAASQLNTGHRVLPTDAPDNAIIPNQVGGFFLEESDSFSSQPNIQRQLTATYKPRTRTGWRIRLSIFLVADRGFQDSLIAQEARCIDAIGNSSIKIQAENNLDYIYSYCGGLGSTNLGLLWKNGDWVLIAEIPAISQAQADLLVQFVNNYPF